MNKKILFVLGVFVLLFILSYFRGSIQKIFNRDERDIEYALIQQHLLNGSPLYGGNKPKLWIHTQYEINARKWKSFQSRNTTDLNQPFIYLTIQSIIHHCGEDFHICLIDDNSFSRLIPSWNSFLKMDDMGASSSHKTAMRQIGLLKILYLYGGMVVPDSFVCKRNLLELYEQGIQGKRPFVCEKQNDAVVANGTKPKAFLPDTYFMGSRRKNEVIMEWADFIKKTVFNDDLTTISHFTAEYDFLGTTNWWIYDAIQGERVNLIDGKWIGIKTANGKSILMEDLIGEAELDLIPLVFGVYIPSGKILRRTNYQWFSVLSIDEIIQSRMIIARYLAKSVENSKPLPAFSLDRQVISI